MTDECDSTREPEGGGARVGIDDVDRRVGIGGGLDESPNEGRLSDTDCSGDKKAVGLLDQNQSPDEDEIRHAIEGNLCRCTGYHNIVRAIEYAAAKMRGEEPAAPDWNYEEVSA